MINFTIFVGLFGISQNVIYNDKGERQDQFND